MINNKSRVGNFTSSEIVALTTEGKAKGSFGKPALTYIEEKNMERRLGRSLDDETTAKPLTWGKLLETRVFDLLGLEYSLTSTDTVVHPEIDFWAGSPDGVKEDEGRTIIDIKAPITLKSFCQLVQPLYDGLVGMEAMNVIRETHQQGDKYYYQLVSNAILENSRFAELIVYMPYQSELPEVIEMAQNVPADELSKHYWIGMAKEGDLPFLKDGGYYKNINIIRFEVPQEDKDYLTGKVLLAGGGLIERPSVVIAELDESESATIN